jgi:hypothetical protein
MSDEFDQFKVLFPIGSGGYGNAYFAVKLLKKMVIH